MKIKIYVSDYENHLMALKDELTEAEEEEERKCIRENIELLEEISDGKEFTEKEINTLEEYIALLEKAAELTDGFYTVSNNGRLIVIWDN